jgi:hypothetical protein
LPVCRFRYSGLALGLLRKASARQRRAWSDGGVDDLDRTVGEAPIAASFPRGAFDGHIHKLSRPVG